MKPVEPIFLSHRFSDLYENLFEVLERLGHDEWHNRTHATRWEVRDVTAHLLDIDIRRLSFQRDGITPPSPEQAIVNYRSLVHYLNDLNARWIEAARRISPRLLIRFIKDTAPQVCELFKSLDPHEQAIFGVAWAGQQTSPNWFDIAREFTERWHHQQQIREAVDVPLLTSPDWLHPVLDTFVRGIPRVLRDLKFKNGQTITLEIDGEGGGQWSFRFEERDWKIYKGYESNASAVVSMPEDIAWRLFSKIIPPEKAKDYVITKGDPMPGKKILNFLGIMA